MKKYLFIIVAFNLLSSHLHCQVKDPYQILESHKQEMKQFYQSQYDKMNAHMNALDNFYHSLDSRRGHNNCTSEYVYVIVIVINSKSTPNWYYCENELSQCNSDFRQLNNLLQTNNSVDPNPPYYRIEKIRNPNYRQGSVNNNDGTNANNEQESSGYTPAKPFFSTTPKSQEDQSLESLVVSQDKAPKSVANDLTVKPSTKDEDQDVVAYIGNSRTPVYKDPSKLVVNTQQDRPVEGADVAYTRPLPPPPASSVWNNAEAENAPSSYPFLSDDAKQKLSDEYNKIKESPAGQLLSTWADGINEAFEDNVKLKLSELGDNLSKAVGYFNKAESSAGNVFAIKDGIESMKHNDPGGVAVAASQFAGKGGSDIPLYHKFMSNITTKYVNQFETVSQTTLNNPSKASALSREFLKNNEHETEMGAENQTAGSIINHIP